MSPDRFTSGTPTTGPATAGPAGKDTTAKAPIARILRKGAATQLRVRPVAAGELTAPAERFDHAAARGYEAGYAEGMASAQSELVRARSDTERLRGRHRAAEASALAALAQGLAMIEADRQRLTEGAIDGVAHAAVALAEAIIGRELTLSASPVLDALRRGLVDAPEGPATIRLCPVDVAALTPAGGPDVFATLAPGRRIQLIADASVEAGGCLIEVGSASIDARISSAVARVSRALLEANRHDDNRHDDNDTGRDSTVADAVAAGDRNVFGADGNLPDGARSSEHQFPWSEL